MTPVDAAVRAEIQRRGPIPFSEVVERALYHARRRLLRVRGQAGRRGDFLTSPEVGPLFGVVVARALDALVGRAGEPDVFPVVEAGAGPGTLARAVLAAGPSCAPALRYVLVERSARQRAATPSTWRWSRRVRLRQPARPRRRRRAARSSPPDRSS